MKNIKKSSILTLFLAGLLSISFFYSSSDAIINDIAAAIKRGNANEVSASFASNIELLLPNNEGTYSHTQAEVMLKKFFNNNRPKSFSVSHQGSSRDGSKYAIGTYTAANGNKFRTYFLVKKVANSYKLHQLQFEKQ